jgi:DNA-binding NtrC family response regulator
MATQPILIVDDEEHTRIALGTALEMLGHPGAVACATLAEARRELEGGGFALVLLDLHLTDGSGEALLATIAAAHPEVPVIVVSGTNEVSTAVRCMRASAVDYLVKPVDPAALEAAVRRALTRSELESENRQLARLARREGLAHPEAFAGIITVDAGMDRLMRYAEIVAPGSQAVLVTGETGTGKELMARALHRLSGRRGQFVAVNVAGLDDAMLADTLFGHRRGAFTGAAGDRPGLVQQADEGTLFLDEIGDLAEASQVKLLRLLQEAEYYQLGADRPRRSRARIVCATHRDLEGWMREGRLRRDLYYRIHAHHLHLPPLRERRDDIPALVHHFVAAAARDLGLPVPPVGAAVVRAAGANPWPGNVRELAAVAQDAVGRGRGQSLDAALFGPAATSEAPALAFPPLLPTLDEVREQLMAEALRRTDGDVVEASRLLGMSRWGLSKHLKQSQSNRLPAVGAS